MKAQCNGLLVILLFVLWTNSVVNSDSFSRPSRKAARSSSLPSSSRRSQSLHSNSTSFFPLRGEERSRSVQLCGEAVGVPTKFVLTGERAAQYFKTLTRSRRILDALGQSVVTGFRITEDDKKGGPSFKICRLDSTKGVTFAQDNKIDVSELENEALPVLKSEAGAKMLMLDGLCRQALLSADVRRLIRGRLGKEDGTGVLFITASPECLTQDNLLGSSLREGSNILVIDADKAACGPDQQRKLTQELIHCIITALQHTQTSTRPRTRSASPKMGRRMNHSEGNHSSDEDKIRPRENASEPVRYTISSADMDALEWQRLSGRRSRSPFPLAADWVPGKEVRQTTLPKARQRADQRTASIHRRQAERAQVNNVVKQALRAEKKLFNEKVEEDDSLSLPIGMEPDHQVMAPAQDWEERESDDKMSDTTEAPHSMPSIEIKDDD